MERIYPCAPCCDWELLWGELSACRTSPGTWRGFVPGRSLENPFIEGLILIWCLLSPLVLLVQRSSSCSKVSCSDARLTLLSRHGISQFTAMDCLNPHLLKFSHQPGDAHRLVISIAMQSTLGDQQLHATVVSGCHTCPAAVLCLCCSYLLPGSFCRLYS